MTDPSPRPVPLPARGLSLLAVFPLEPGDETEWDAAEPKLGARLVRHGDLAALVCPAPPPGGYADPLHVTARHWEVHRALLRGDVAPAPAGLVFESDAAVEAFLTRSHAALRGALARVAGRWEFRLHVKVVETGFSESKALDLTTHIYAELRRISSGALPLPRTADRVLSAAFLVPRATSAAFQDRADELARLNSALELDATGPWPPYDFVHMHP